LKIKPPSSANRRLAALRAINHQWWLMPAKPRKAGRLKQLNKEMPVRANFQRLAVPRNSTRDPLNNLLLE
jgi:hypothetical protein